jgi:hypothetical protein
MIFSFGARRSGTWWLQRIITAHPTVAAVPSESFFFSNAIAPLFEGFQSYERDATWTGRIYADRELLLDATREFCDRIFAQFAGGEADRVAERTPWHVREIDLMTDLYPDAYYIHIYRDGRDSARSLASMEWYDGSLEDAANEWRGSVLAPLSARRPERYLEVRYEDLLGDPRPKIEELYEFLDLEMKPGVLEAALAEAQRELSTDPGSSVGTEKWRRLLSPEQQAAIVAIAGDALAHYGYVSEAEAEAAKAAVAEPADGGSAPARILRRVRGRG